MMFYNRLAGMTPLKSVTFAYWFTSHSYYTVLFNMLYSNDQSKGDTKNLSCLVKYIYEVYDNLAGSG